MHLKLKLKFKSFINQNFFKSILFSFGVTTIVSLYSYNEFDPSLFTVNDETPLNILGNYGANLSAILFVIFEMLLGCFLFLSYY